MLIFPFYNVWFSASCRSNCGGVAEIGCKCDATCLLDSGNCCHDFKEQCPAEVAKGKLAHSYYSKVKYL